MVSKDPDPTVTSPKAAAGHPTNLNRREAAKMVAAIAIGVLCGAVFVGPQLDSWRVEPGAADVAMLALVTVHVVVAPSNVSYPIPPVQAISLNHCSGAAFSEGKLHLTGSYDPTVSTVVIVRYPYGESFSGGGDDVAKYFLHDGEYATIPLALMSNRPAMEVKAGPPPFVNWVEAQPSGGSSSTANYLVEGSTAHMGFADGGQGNYSVTESYLVEFVPRVQVFLHSPSPCM